LKWVLLAAFIAIPFAFVFIENWLNNFAYRISIHWWFFLLAIIIALFISTGTILIKVLRAANTNPANTLRYE
jgi:putative ABC transport system permease protein